MSTYQKKLRMIKMYISYGDQQETLRLIKRLVPTMLPTEMTMIIYQCILGEKIKIIEYCLDNPYELRLLRLCTNLVDLAVESGSAKSVETILSRKINDINATDGKGQNALLIAYKTNNYDKINLLLRYGAECYPPKKNKLFQRDRILTRSSYLEKPVNRVKPDRNDYEDFVDKYVRVLNGETPSQVLELNALLWQFDIDLTYQRVRDNIKIIEYCLDNLYEPRLLRHCSWEGTNLVHLAVESESVKAVETILSREINDINATDGKGQNALLIAYKTNNYNNMNLLLR
ncbi:hypothetical protein TSAR_003287 [Trichomalopsis sarcophagae]|uniref:Ankyrin repeat protein n=1 Tax=Trichomalopsis sarcophagae TaxID=543379 RepID=A0A232ENM9_9HYME|nr:hypothetical protein TSAR_003287 [Trichomalopsis sarcophagae]